MQRDNARATPPELDAADEEPALELAEAGRLLRRRVDARQFRLGKGRRREEVRVDERAHLRGARRVSSTSANCLRAGSDEVAGGRAIAPLMLERRRLAQPPLVRFAYSCSTDCSLTHLEIRLVALGRALERKRIERRGLRGTDVDAVPFCVPRNDDAQDRLGWLRGVLPIQRLDEGVSGLCVVAF